MQHGRTGERNKLFGSQRKERAGAEPRRRDERQPPQGQGPAYGVTPKAGLSNFTPLRTA